MMNDLAPASYLHLIEPEDEEDDWANNASFIRDKAADYGLPPSASWEQVQEAILADGYQEIRLTHENGTNHFYLRPQQYDRFEWLDPYLK